MGIFVKLCNIKYTKYIFFSQFFKKYIFYISTRAQKVNPHKRELEKKYFKGEKTMARVLISMPEKFLDEIDQVADTENRSRSELIREALRTYIQRTKIRENSFASKNAAILEALLD